MSSNSHPGDDGLDSTIEDVQEKYTNRPFGDRCDGKDKSNVRIMFQNVNGLGYTSNSVKTLGVRDLMYNHEIDIMGMSETNINWSKVSRNQTLPQIGRRWFQTSKTVIGYNQHQQRTRVKHQPGGTAIMSKGEMALRVQQQFYDSQRLGRWVAQSFQGKNGIITRMVSVYVPIVARTHGHKKVFCQQQKALLAMGITEPVIKIFWEDFWLQIDKWISDGEQLVIGGDWNNNVTSKQFLKPFEQRGLIPVISTRFGNNLPATYNHGSYAIDEIFVSPTLHVHKAGYLEHGSNLSDHRPLWVDISKTSMLGVKSSLKPTYAARKLKTNDPRVVNKYLNDLNSLLIKDNLYERTSGLMNQIDEKLTDAQQKEYEQIDKLKTDAMREAEKHCRKLKMGEVCWSPKIQLVRDKIRYYSLSKRRYLGRKVSARILLRLSKKTGCNATNLTDTEIDLQLNNLFKMYRSLKKEHVKHREDFLNSLASAMEKAGKGKKANNVKALISVEAQRAIFRRLAAINKKTADLSTKCVTVTDEKGQRVITDKKEMEEAIINENRHKYHQTESSCPFMTEPLKSHFGKLGKGPHTEDVLQGTYIPPDTISDQTKRYIELCRLPQDNLIINPLTRNLDYYCKSWRKMKERTSSRDLHFGHYRAAVERNSIMDLHYKLAEIPFRTGYSPRRWKEATNVMILKKEGNTNLDKLRTLVLFEADFNHNNKFLGRSMMHHAVDKSLLAKEQYSAPGKKCIDHVVNRKLYFDLIRYQKSSAAMSGVDLKSCYDRVAHAPAYLAMRSYGFPSQPIESMFECIQDMQYYTLTAHGMSSTSFGGKEKGYKAAPNGLGQGNGAGPSVWSIVSSKMFQVMHSRGASTTITSPITNDTIDICGFAFVDDTDLIAMSPDGCNDPSESINRMQYVVNEWEAVSKSTGGALVPKKCWGWIISFKWINDNWSYNTNTDDLNPLTVKDEANKVHNIEMLLPHEAKEMLGVRLAPDGNQKQQFSATKMKLKQYAEYIRTGHISRHEAWISLNMITMKSLEYMLPAMTLTEQEYNELMKPVLAQFLPKIGINRNIKRDLLYSPLETQGFNIKSPFILQGTDHVKDILEHLWKDSITGKLLRCNLEQLRIELGTNIDILNGNYSIFEPYILTESYISSTWKFMSDNNITLDDKTKKIPLLRENDTCIMDAFINNKNIPRSSLGLLNRCRMYLKVFTLADISEGSGKLIHTQAWHGRRSDNIRTDISNWPNWGRPSLQSWSYWRTALKLTFCTDKDRILKHTLGYWKIIPQGWKWFSATNNKSDQTRLIHKDDKGKIFHHPKIGRSKLHSRYKDTYNPTTVQAGETLIPTTVQATHKSYIMSTATGLDENKDESPNTKRTEWLNIDRTTKGANSILAKALINGQALAVSDGSYKEDKGLGSASWIISTKDKKYYTTAGCICPGTEEIQSSYRSELVGVLGILEEIDYLCNKWNIKEGKCYIYCDGITALNIIDKSHRHTVSTRFSNCDIVSACVKLKETIPIQLVFEHVKGHQEDHRPIQALPVPAQLNILMDSLAKDLMDDLPEKAGYNLHEHRLSFTLPRHKNRPIYHKLKEFMYRQIMNEKAHCYWIEEKKRYTSEDKENIHWEYQEKAFKTLKGTRQRNLSKWFSGWIATGKNTMRWNIRYKGHCPFCHKDKEDKHHIIHCSHIMPTKQWNTLLKEYDKKLIRYKTSFALRKAIILELRAWRNNTNLPSLTFADPELTGIILNQRRLGWLNFLEGLITKDMFKYQRAYLDDKHPRLQLVSWSKKILRANWHLILNIWQFRNKNLHEKDTIQNLEGKQVLEKTIIKEWNRGLNRLPILEFSHLFRLKKEELMKKSLEGKKDWLMVVKIGRQIHSDNDQPDEFDTNEALRQWIGLSKN